MIAAQWEPFLRMCQAVGTVGGILLMFFAALHGAMAVLDAWRHHRCPEHALIHQRQQLDAWFKAETERTEGYR